MYLFNKLHSELSETVDSKDSHLLILITPHFVKVLTYHMPDLTPLKPEMWRFMAVYGGLWRFVAVYGGLWRFVAVCGSKCE